MVLTLYGMSEDLGACSWGEDLEGTRFSCDLSLTYCSRTENTHLLT